MQLDVIMLTHDSSNVHSIKRQVNASKSEIVMRCLRSLVNSIEISTHDINLTILDDHSSDETLKQMRELTEVTPLEEHGNHNGFSKMHEMGMESRSDLVYMTNDDFLHTPEAVEQICETWQLFNQRFVGPIALDVLDDPDNYGEVNIIHQCRILPGPDRPWRTNHHTTSSFVIEPCAFKTYRRPFQELTKGYGHNGVTPDTTINPLWLRGDITLFTPLIPLAYHLNENTHPYYNLTDLWESMKIYDHKEKKLCQSYTRTLPMA